MEDLNTSLSTLSISSARSFLDLPTELVERVFDEIKKSGFRSALTPACKVLRPLYQSALYYDIDLFTDEIPSLLQSVSENWGLLNLIQILTIREREVEGDSERAFALLVVSARQVKELSIFGYEECENIDIYEILIDPDFLYTVPKLESLCIHCSGDSWAVYAREVAKFLDFHPHVRSLSINCTDITILENNEMRDSFDRITKLELVGEVEDENYLEFLSYFKNVQDVSLDQRLEGYDRAELSSPIPDFSAALEIISQTAPKLLKKLRLGSSKIYRIQRTFERRDIEDSIATMLELLTNLETLRVFHPVITLRDLIDRLDFLPHLNLILFSAAIPVSPEDCETLLEQKLDPGQRNLTLRFCEDVFVGSTGKTFEHDDNRIGILS